MPVEDEKARAARKSREWKARQAEIAAAHEHDRSYDDGVLRERIERYHESRWTHVVLPLAIGVSILLYHQWETMAGRVGYCLSGPAARLHGENCANTIADSFWWWMLSSEQKELIRAAQVGDR